MSSPSQTPALDLAQFEGFTPGPWSPSFDDRHVESDEGAICEVYPQDLAGNDGEVSEDESRACEANNAALIAAAPALLAECRRLREREQVLAEALARILRIHNRPKGWNRIEHARSIEAWEADARAALALTAAAPALLAECERLRERERALRDALADADAYLRRALVATVDMADLAEAREDLYAGRNMVRAALASGGGEGVRGE